MIHPLTVRQVNHVLPKCNDGETICEMTPFQEGRDWKRKGIIHDKKFPKLVRLIQQFLMFTAVLVDLVFCSLDQLGFQDFPRGHSLILRLGSKPRFWILERHQTERPRSNWKWTYLWKQKRRRTCFLTHADLHILVHSYRSSTQELHRIFFFITQLSNEPLTYCWAYDLVRSDH